MGASPSFPRGRSAFGNRRVMCLTSDDESNPQIVNCLTIGGGDGKTQYIIARDCDVHEADDSRFAIGPASTTKELYDKFEHMCIAHWEVSKQNDAPALEYGTYVRVRDVPSDQQQEEPKFVKPMQACVGKIGVVAGCSDSGFPIVHHMDSDETTGYSYQEAWLEPVSVDQVSEEELAHYMEYMTFCGEIRAVRALYKEKCEKTAAAQKPTPVSLEDKIDALSAKIDVLMQKMDE